jgi:hypothetical protein
MGREERKLTLASQILTSARTESSEKLERSTPELSRFVLPHNAAT